MRFQQFYTHGVAIITPLCPKRLLYHQPIASNLLWWSHIYGICKGTSIELDYAWLRVKKFCECVVRCLRAGSL